jgi:hypothetical protein
MMSTVRIQKKKRHGVTLKRMLSRCRRRKRRKERNVKERNVKERNANKRNVKEVSVFPAPLTHCAE